MKAMVMNLKTLPSCCMNMLTCYQDTTSINLSATECPAMNTMNFAQSLKQIVLKAKTKKNNDT